MGCGNSSTKQAKSPSVKIPTQATTSELLIKPSTFVRNRGSKIADDYDFQELLGSGAFGQVKKATHRATGNIRAVKIIHKSVLQPQQMDEKHQLKEVDFLRELDHPNILRVYELYEDRMRFYVVMEYCAGGELFTLLSQRKSFTEADAAKLMFQMLSAVAYCHQKKVIHRDLKPENVLLEEKNDDSLAIKIADFGSSAYLDIHGRMNDVFGSPYYIAPEVLTKRYNEKCDMWSLGIILYILLTGKPPYQGKHEAEIMEHVTNGELSLTKIDSLSPQAKDLISRLLVRTVKERLSAAQALTHPWIQRFRNSSDADSAVLSLSLRHMREFNNSSKLRDAIYTYIACQIMSQADIKELTVSFQALDKNGDGRVSRDELMSLYLTTLGPVEAEKEVSMLMKNVDTDRSGFIDYSEFLKASLDRAKLLSKRNLETTFNAFDTDSSGTISAQELRAMLSSDAVGDINVWQALITEADENGDGVLDMKEFQTLIMKRM